MAVNRALAPELQRDHDAKRIAVGEGTAARGEPRPDLLGLAQEGNRCVRNYFVSHQSNFLEHRLLKCVRESPEYVFQN